MKKDKVLNIDVIFENADWPKINQKNKRREKMAEVKEVSKEKFDTYVKIQKSGVTNMWAVSVVVKVSTMFYEVELTKEDCFYIMKHYGELKEKYQ